MSLYGAVPPCVRAPTCATLYLYVAGARTDARHQPFPPILCPSLFPAFSLFFFFPFSIFAGWKCSDSKQHSISIQMICAKGFLFFFWKLIGKSNNKAKRYDVYDFVRIVISSWKCILFDELYSPDTKAGFFSTTLGIGRTYYANFCILNFGKLDPLRVGRKQL